MKFNQSGILLVFLFFIFSCNNTSSINSQNEIKVLKLKAEADNNLFYFSGGKSIIGLDPETDESILELAFNTFVSFGDITKDNRLIIMDNGNNPGVWGEKLFIVNSEGGLEMKLNVYPNPFAAKIMGHYLFVTNGSYTSEGRTGLNIFNINDYSPLFESKEMGEIINQNDIQFHNNQVLIAVNPFQPIGRPGYLFSIELPSLKTENHFEISNPCPWEPYDILVCNNKLMVVFGYSYHVCVFDLSNKNLINKIDMSPLITIPAQNEPGDFEIASPLFYNEKIILLARNRISSEIFQKLLVLNQDSFELEREIPLENKVPVSFMQLKYIFKDKIYFEGSGFVSIFDYVTGNLIREIDFGFDKK